MHQVHFQSSLLPSHLLKNCTNTPKSFSCADDSSSSLHPWCRQFVSQETVTHCITLASSSSPSCLECLWHSWQALVPCTKLFPLPILCQSFHTLQAVLPESEPRPALQPVSQGMAANVFLLAAAGSSNSCPCFCPHPTCWLIVCETVQQPDWQPIWVKNRLLKLVLLPRKKKQLTSIYVLGFPLPTCSNLK